MLIVYTTTPSGTVASHRRVWTSHTGVSRELTSDSSRTWPAVSASRTVVIVSPSRRSRAKSGAASPATSLPPTTVSCSPSSKASPVRSSVTAALYRFARGSKLTGAAGAPTVPVRAGKAGPPGPQVRGRSHADRPRCLRVNLGVDGTVQVIHLTTYDAAKYESAKKDALTRSGVVAVTGIGDDAFYDPGVTSAAVHKGDTVYFVGALFHAKPGGVLDAAKIKAEDLAMAKAVAAAIR